ncbi:MAG TPA: condensation domain-containing protein, partial [Fluviicola sp.]|nr:condensation domain-containing protein [Fluviicola sp.]
MLSLIKKIKEYNIALWVDGDKIKMSFGEASPAPELIDEIRENKPQLIEFLSKHTIFSEAAFDHFNISDTSAETANAGQENDIDAIFPATSLQQGLVFHFLSNPTDDAYRVQLIVDYRTKLDIDKYQEAWKCASLKYPILRTAFDWEEEILQVITKKPGITKANFSFRDLSDLTEDERELKIAEIQEEDRKVPFDLSRPGLIRFTILKLEEALFTVVRTEHHSISDGWSGGFLLHTVHQFYNALIRGEKPVIEVETAYLDAQKYYLEANKNITSFWEKSKAEFELANDVNMLFNHRINLDQQKSVEHPGELSVQFEGNGYSQLKDTCRNLGVTLNVAVQFAWHLLLQRYTRDEQTIVGTTVSGRDIPVPEIETSVGLYTNTLPLAVNWKKDASIREMLHEVQEKSAALNSYSSVSLASLQKHGDRLFHSICAYLNYPDVVSDATDQKGIEYTISLRKAVEKVDYPVMLRAHDSGQRLLLELKYGKNWIGEERAAALLEQVQFILNAVGTNPEQTTDQVSLINDAQREILLQKWNQTDVFYPFERTLQELFEQQVIANNDKVAVVHGKSSLTYGELNARANRL